MVGDAEGLGEQRPVFNQRIDVWGVRGPHNLGVGVILFDDENDVVRARYGGCWLGSERRNGADTNQ